MGFIIFLIVLLKKNILYLIFIDTNCKNALISNLQIIISFIKYVLYFWYIDKNVVINYKPLFNKKKIDKHFIIINEKFYIKLLTLF